MAKVKIPEKIIYQFDVRDERVNGIIDYLNDLALKNAKLEKKVNDIMALLGADTIK